MPVHNIFEILKPIATPYFLETSISKTLDSPGAMNPSIEKHVSNPNIQIKDNSSKKIFFHEKNIFENTAAQKHYGMK